MSYKLSKHISNNTKKRLECFEILLLYIPKDLIPIVDEYIGINFDRFFGEFIIKYNNRQLSESKKIHYKQKILSISKYCYINGIRYEKDEGKVYLDNNDQHIIQIVGLRKLCLLD